MERMDILYVTRAGMAVTGYEQEPTLQSIFIQTAKETGPLLNQMMIANDRANISALQW